MHKGKQGFIASPYLQFTALPLLSFFNHWISIKTRAMNKGLNNAGKARIHGTIKLKGVNSKLVGDVKKYP